MSAQLRETAGELADVLWREHTVYRERGGGVVIRGEHVQRWISIAPGGGRDEVLLRAGRILDGGTTAPARSEAVARLDAGTGELAATCRRLLAEAAADAAPPPSRRRAPARSGRQAEQRRNRPQGRHTSLGSWVVILCVAGVVVLYAYQASAVYR
ncbi:hypothetical protein [Streptomyces sp. FIT100]|uniref:hypothetical protein n=1 Tax=Streptomyces sp. FIT100 TaxID=2837956 RepID=UPI0021C6F74B|nr:hypothetical protein [Streptomyces sp. FIT100]UUN30395.1 hypothetical protein KK483_31660 [Streptomyces sp. FIT100]